MNADVAVIGAGPAGMAVARDLAARGLSVQVLDERSAPGGNIHAAALQRPLAAASLFGAEYRKGAAAVQAFAASGIPVAYGASVMRVEGEVVHYSLDGRMHQLRAKRLVLATGAIERPVPFPGWDLPGVMGAGAFQLILKQSRVVPGGDYVIAGSGPLALLLACQLLALGSKPSAILDTSTAPFRAGLVHLPVLAGNMGAVAKGLGFLAKLRLRGVRIISGVTGLQAHGGAAVEEITYTRHGGPGGSLKVGMALVHEGVIPNTQLALALECRSRWDAAQQCLVPQVDEWGESSRPGTFLIGDAAGILGAEAALHSARLAALRIAQQLGRPAQGADAAEASARRALTRLRGLRGFLDAAYAPRLAAAPPADGTLICRCEQVTAGALRAAVRDGAQGPAQAKVFTRCGMGLCQGRICGNPVTRLIAAEIGQDPGAVGGYHVRYPLKPLSLAELAEEDPDDDTSTRGHLNAASV